jgi:hypothetical protein
VVRPASGEPSAFALPGINFSPKKLDAPPDFNRALTTVAA